MKKWKWNLNKSQRMQLKALACVLGILLIVGLLIGRTIIYFVRDTGDGSTEEEIEKEREPEPVIPIPVITYLENVWIMEVMEEGLLVFCEGAEETFPYGINSHDNNLELSGRSQELPGGTGELYQVPRDYREQVADITLTDGHVTGVRIKDEKVSGKVLSAAPDSIELEGIGRIPMREDAQGYRLYKSLSMCTISDIAIGYDFNDFVLDDGEICAILIVKEEAMEYIRVLIRASDYSGTLHESVTFTGNTDYTIFYGEQGDIAEELVQAGAEHTIDIDSPYFQSGSPHRVTIVPGVLTGRIILKSVGRSQGIPSYRGTIELVKTEGGIAVINEVLLEEYLYSVIPSEMPASYPSEALKAQAICARTYAYRNMLKAGYPRYGAHLDDSTSYQVYNNINEQEATTTAAKETYGQLLYTVEDELAGTYYYSTSCGLGSDANVWKSSSVENLNYLQGKSISRTAMERMLSRERGDEIEGEDGNTVAGGGEAAAETIELDRMGEIMMEEEYFDVFIRTKNNDDFESAEGWYRWTYTVNSIDSERMLEVLKKRYEANNKLILTLNSRGTFVSTSVQRLGNIKDIHVVKRGSGGVADELIIETDRNTFKVISEHNIRYVLNNGVSSVHRQDGSQVAMPNLLPSGFFVIEINKEEENVKGYTLVGGGFGHGVGMSQNGARAMAQAGYRSDEILRFFYDGCLIRNVYEEEEVSDM